MSKLSNTVAIIGAPSDLGANIRGTCLGPDTLRLAGLAQSLNQSGLEVVDHGNVEVPIREQLSSQEADSKFRHSIFKTCEKIYDKTLKALQENQRPLLIGGDHSLAVGSISAVSHHCQQQGRKLGCIWFDAHADINTPASSPSGNIHGMPVSMLLGSGHQEYRELGHQEPKLDPSRLALVGLRSIDSEEKTLCRNAKLHAFTMREVDSLGMKAVLDQILTEFKNQGVDWIHASFDIDALDPICAPAVSTPVSGGLTARESRLALEMLAETQIAHSMDLVELNPVHEQNLKTAQLSIELACSFFGYSIL